MLGDEGDLGESLGSSLTVLENSLTNAMVSDHTRSCPRGPEQEARLSHPTTMFSSSFVLSLLLLGLASAYQLEDTFLEEYDEASDPRLFFSNFTSGLP